MTQFNGSDSTVTTGADLVSLLLANDIANKLVDDTAVIASGIVRGNVVKYNASTQRWELCDGTVSLAVTDVIGIVEYASGSQGQVRIAGIYTDINNLAVNGLYYCQSNGTLGTMVTKIYMGRVTSPGRLCMPAGGGGISPATATTLGGIKSSEVTADGTLPSHGKQLFTATGSFTVPDGVTKAYISLCGGGGNGGSGALSSTDGYAVGGGGGGGGAAKLAYAVTGLTPGAVIPVTVGGIGGISSFGAYVSCSGGGNGAAGGTNSYGGNGGSAGGVGGIAGQRGDDSVTYGALGGHGGGCIFGSGGAGASINAPAITGTGYGSGGGGGCVSYAAAAGQPGMVLVEW